MYGTVKCFFVVLTVTILSPFRLAAARVVYTYFMLAAILLLQKFNSKSNNRKSEKSYLNSDSNELKKLLCIRQVQLNITNT